MAWLQDPMAAASRWLDGAANAVLCRRRLLHAQSTQSRLQMDTRVSQGGRRPLVVVVVCILDQYLGTNAQARGARRAKRRSRGLDGGVPLREANQGGRGWRRGRRGREERQERRRGNKTCECEGERGGREGERGGESERASERENKRARERGRGMEMESPMTD